MSQVTLTALSGTHGQAFRFIDPWLFGPRILTPSFYFFLLKPVRTHADNSDKYMDIKELSETALLDHAMTSKKRSKAIEEFLKLTFKSQVDSNCCHEDLVNLGLFSFGSLLKFLLEGGFQPIRMSMKPEKRNMVTLS